MRVNTPEQTSASRANGATSKGPKSAKGKEKVRLNAVKDGLFSKELIIESAGERWEEFEKVKEAVSDFFRPTNTVEEMLVADFVENWWRRKRIRSAESAEMKSRLDTVWIRDHLQRSDEVEELKVRFLSLLGKFTSPDEDFSEIVRKLEEARTELSSTAGGVQFLIAGVENIAKEAESEGTISPNSEILLLAYGGLTNERSTRCIQMNHIYYKQQAAAEKAKRMQPTTEEPVSENPLIAELKRSGLGEEFCKTLRQALKDSEATSRQVLASSIRSIAQSLALRQKLLEQIEHSEMEARAASAIVPSDNQHERFARAETAVERRMYRALGMLLALRGAAGNAKMLA